MKVNIEELEKVTLILFSRLRESIGNEIELNHDFYWDISEEELYNPYENPTDIGLGQLSDDLKRVQNLFKSDEDAVAYDLRKIAPILMALSIENPIAF